MIKAEANRTSKPHRVKDGEEAASVEPDKMEVGKWLPTPCSPGKAEAAGKEEAAIPTPSKHSTI